MIKSELILRLASQNPHLFQRDVAKLVNVVVDEIIGALVRGDRVELRGFGTFSVTRRRGRVGRNPRTGAKVNVPEKKIPHFSPGHEMRKRLNPDAAEADEPSSSMD